MQRDAKDINERKVQAPVPRKMTIPKDVLGLVKEFGAQPLQPVSRLVFNNRYFDFSCSKNQDLYVFEDNDVFVESGKQISVRGLEAAAQFAIGKCRMGMGRMGMEDGIDMEDGINGIDVYVQDIKICSLDANREGDLKAWILGVFTLLGKMYA